MKRASLLVMLLGGVLALAQSAPTQPSDPTAQSPATPAPATQAPGTQAPTTPQTFPESKANKTGEDAGQQSAKPSTEESPNSPAHAQGRARVFMGRIEQSKDGFVLKAGDVEYKLDDQAQAKKYQQKNVRVLGSLDEQNNVIHVQSIEPSPSI